MFHTIDLTRDGASDFDTLTQSIPFEQFPPTRQVANIAEFNSKGHIPIVRTTTTYKQQVQPMPPAFLALRDAITKAITTATGRCPEFNNAMAELYEPEYRKMGFHTDQAQDLAEDSLICISSCYESSSASSTPSNGKAVKPSPPRLLIVNDKRSGDEKNVTEIPMHDNSRIVFSTATKALHKHKIVGRGCTRRWLGITFRTSKTYVERREEKLYFVDSGRLLREAREEEAVEIRKCKGEENRETAFEWPEMDFTLSEH